MIVVLDANVLIHDTAFKKDVWAQLAEAITGGTIKVVVPTYVVDEVIAHYSRLRRESITSISATSRKLSPTAKALLDPVFRQINTEIEDFTGSYSARIRSLGFTVVGVPAVEHDELVHRAIERIRPFNGSGSGYRDALHWFAMLELMDEDPDEDFVFVSDDLSAFQKEGSKNDLNLEIHPELQEDVNGRLSDGSFMWLRKVDDLAIPGYFTGEPFEPSIDETEFSRFLLETLPDWTFEDLGLEVADLDVEFADSASLNAVMSADVLSVEGRRVTLTRKDEFRLVASIRAKFDVYWLDEATETMMNDRVSHDFRIRATITGRDSLEELDSLDDVSPIEQPRRADALLNLRDMVEVIQHINKTRAAESQSVVQGIVDIFSQVAALNQKAEKTDDVAFG